MAKKKSTRSTSKPILASSRICNLVPSTGTEKDWGFQDAVRAGSLTVARALPPASKDLRQDWWTVNDQGSTGSCVGWASTDGVMRYQLVMAGKLDKATLLSPRFTWMASKETDIITPPPPNAGPPATLICKRIWCSGAVGLRTTAPSWPG
jgi:hypothetical protein